MNIEQIRTFFENPNIIDALTDNERHELFLKSIFYSLEYEIDDQIALTFIQDFLLKAKDESVINFALNLLLQKAVSKNDEANQILFDHVFNYPNPEYLSKISKNNIVPINPNYKLLLPFYENQTSKITKTEDFYLALSAFFLSASKELKSYLIQKAEYNQLINWSITAKYVLHQNEKTQLDFIKGYQTFSTQEKKIALNLLVQTKNKILSESLFRLFVLYQDKIALNTVQENKLSTQNQSDLALFFILTNQWHRYEALDFDGSLLKSAYLDAPQSLRQKILAQSRVAGKVAWLQELTDQRETKWITDLNEADWEKIILRLIAQKDKNGLLRLLNVIPPIQAKKVIQLIHGALNEASIFTHDKEWVNLVESVKQLSKTIPMPVVEKETLALSKDNLLSSVVSHSQTELFIGTTSTDVQKINLKVFKLDLPAIPTSNPHTRQIKITKDHLYLIIAHGDNQIRVMRLSDKQIIKIFAGHTGFIKSLALSQDEKALFSTGFDGKLIKWRFPLGPVLNSKQISDAECFDMHLSSNQLLGLAADANGWVHVFETDSLSSIKKFQISKEAITNFAIGNQTSLAAFYDNSRTLSLWNFESGIQLAKQTDSPYPITKLLFSSFNDYIIAGDTNGGITFYAAKNLSVIGTTQIHKNAILNIHALDRDRLLIVCRDGKVFILNNHLTNSIFTSIRLIKDEIKLSSKGNNINSWKNFVNTYFHFIHRHDIQIDEIQRIDVGEFDIQID